MQPPLLTLYNTLVDRLNQASHAYYVKHAPILTDPQFDQLFQQVKKLETEHPNWKRSDSPTQRIGSDLIPGFVKGAHAWPMLSIENMFTHEELQKAAAKLLAASPAEGKLLFVLEPKVDGISLDLEYHDGKLVRALTRGDGLEGDDVTANARTIRDLPLRLHNYHGQGKTYVRGEVHMTFEVFERLNAQRIEAKLPKLANPRNAAGGALRSLDPKEASKRCLSFKAYYLHDFNLDLETMHEMHAQLATFGFNAIRPEDGFKCLANLEELVEAVATFEVERKSLPYPTDGAVIKANYLQAHAELGASSTCINWAYAYKYAPDVGLTTVKGITIQVGKSGVLAPVAELEPLELAGSTIARVTLHNEAFIQKHDVRVGSLIELQKAGEIIPQVNGVREQNNSAEPYRFPESCPACGTLAVRETIEDGTKEGVALLCPNPGCRGRLCAQLVHWASRSVMDIEDLGDAAATILVNSGLDSVAMLYELHEDDFYSLFGAVAAKNLYERVQASKRRGLKAVLIGMVIPMVGDTACRRLAQRFQSWEALATASNDEIMALEGITSKCKLKLVAWRRNPEYLSVMHRLRDAGVDLTSKDYNPNAASGPLAGKTFVVTGTLSVDREIIHSRIEAAGGRATGSVSKKTSYLVAGSDVGASKMNKAKELGVAVISEADLMILLNGNTETTTP